MQNKRKIFLNKNCLFNEILFEINYVEQYKKPIHKPLKQLKKNLLLSKYLLE